MDSTTLNLLYADNDKELIDNAIIHLKAMDWTYHYSDDQRAYNKGIQLEAKLKSAMVKLDREIAAILFDNYCGFLNKDNGQGGWKNPYKD